MIALSNTGLSRSVPITAAEDAGLCTAGETPKRLRSGNREGPRRTHRREERRQTDPARSWGEGTRLPLRVCPPDSGTGRTHSNKPPLLALLTTLQVSGWR
ncbi:hypothetical protein NDU88_003920 [Pleurodeles waltl]|uniref:Uncharacterized protein n=1 Tax=Pleurodeles waltl TaxID=8319 RepID=A0AAV7PB93_PLEWA|nr:hypothetical protein NDU88_003920 [Pleurodeles waltl]